MAIEARVAFSRLKTDTDMAVHHSDSSNAILGVSYEDSKRWKKKTMHARCGIAIFTLVCTALLIVLLTTYELQLNCAKCSMKTTAKKRSLEDSVKFLLASDLHFDYYYNDIISKSPTFCRKLGNYTNASYKAPYGRVGCDTPEALVDNMLNGMKSVYDKSGADFMLITGDFSAHKTDASYFTNGTTGQRVLNNIKVAANKMLKAFPHIPIFPMLGNNDLEGHYVLPSSDSDQWYNQTLAVFAPMILCNGCPGGTPKPTTIEELKSTFLDGGYYCANIANGRVVLLVLNTLYWNVEASVGSTYIQNKAIKQMKWLQQQLILAKQQGKKVILSSHIPPGIDPYGVQGKPFWLSNYTSMFTSLVAGQYHDVIAGQFYAHIHKDDFKLQLSTQALDNQPPVNKSFALLVPSLSVVYANNPSFRQVYMDAGKQAILDYDQYYMDIVMATALDNPHWQFDYRFSERYPSSLGHIDAARIYELNQKLINQSTEKNWLSYAFSRTVKYQVSSYSRFGLYCAMRHVITTEYESCMKKHNIPGG